VRGLTPLVVAVLVTAFCSVYGTHSWSWLAGPVAGVFVWALDRNAHEPQRPPSPVD
jgi:hypothetical protein